MVAMDQIKILNRSYLKVTTLLDQKPFTELKSVENDQSYGHLLSYHNYWDTLYVCLSIWYKVNDLIVARIFHNFSERVLNMFP